MTKQQIANELKNARKALSEIDTKAADYHSQWDASMARLRELLAIWDALKA